MFSEINDIQERRDHEALEGKLGGGEGAKEGSMFSLVCPTLYSIDPH